MINREVEKNMKKTYNVKPINEIELVFEDKYKLDLRFDARATYHMTTEFDLEVLVNNPSVSEMCAIIVYSASVENNKDMTIEKARELVCEMDLETITNIVLEFEKSSGVSNDEQMKELQKKTMEEFVLNLYKKKR